MFQPTLGAIGQLYVLSEADLGRPVLGISARIESTSGYKNAVLEAIVHSCEFLSKSAFRYSDLLDYYEA